MSFQVVAVGHRSAVQEERSAVKQEASSGSSVVAADGEIVSKASVGAQGWPSGQRRGRPAQHLDAPDRLSHRTSHFEMPCSWKALGFESAEIRRTLKRVSAGGRRLDGVRRPQQTQARGCEKEFGREQRETLTPCVARSRLLDPPPPFIPCSIMPCLPSSHAEGASFILKWLGSVFYGDEAAKRATRHVLQVRRR